MREDCLFDKERWEVFEIDEWAEKLRYGVVVKNSGEIMVSYTNLFDGL